MGILRRSVVLLLIITFISLCVSGSVQGRKTAGKCGKPYRGTRIITRGDNFTRDDYPWNVALMYKNKTGLEFFCGGTLVSLSHVVTGEIVLRWLQSSEKNHLMNQIKNFLSQSCKEMHKNV